MPDLKLLICRREFHVSCAASDEANMQKAAGVVEDRIQTLRQKTNTADGERLALMTALQIAFESLAESPDKKSQAAAAEIRTLCLRLQKRMDNTLTRTESSLHKRALNGVNQ